MSNLIKADQVNPLLRLDCFFDGLEGTITDSRASKASEATHFYCPITNVLPSAQPWMSGLVWATELGKHCRVVIESHDLGLPSMPTALTL